jgi:hypothetical protein
MGALVIYESMFGNTRRIAEAIAAGIREHLPVELLEVSHAPLAIDPSLELVVVGGPTHMHGMTTVKSRAAATERTTDPLVSPSIGMREWFEQLAPAIGSPRAAAFDTRVNGPKVLTGSAAGRLNALLRGAGFDVISEPESFRVVSKGPRVDDALLAGELEEAREWGRALAGKVPQRV